MKYRYFIGLTTSLVISLLLSVSCKPASRSDFACDNVACDTIDTYSLRQYCPDTTIDYNLTYRDTARLIRADGELSFSISQCRNCTGKLEVPIVDEQHQVIDTVQVNYSGDGISDRINITALGKAANGTLRVDWKTGGKVFYIKLQ